MKKILLVMLALVLVIISGMLVFESDQKEQRQQKHILKLQKEAEPYESELQEIRQDLEERSRAIYSSSDISSSMVGFVMTSAGDMDLVKEVANEYSFTPIIVLNCDLSQDILLEILQKASEQNYEIMLSGMTFDENVLKTADIIRDQGTDYGYDQDVVFMIRKKCDSDKNRNLLKQHEYKNIIYYDSMMKSDISGKMRYIPYRFVRSNVSAYINTIEYAVSEKVDIIWLFNIEEIENGKLSKGIITDFLQILDKRIKEGTMHYIKLGEAFYALAKKEGLMQEAEEEYTRYKEEQKVRIDELEAEIDKIYSCWNEY